MNWIKFAFAHVALLLLAPNTPLQAVEITAGPTAVVENGTVVVTWTTDGISGTRFHYGKQPQALHLKKAGGIGVNHRVILDDLNPEAKYHFSLGTSKKWLWSGTITRNGDGSVTLNITDERVSSPAVSTPGSSPGSMVPGSRPLPKLSPLKPVPIKPPARELPAPKVPPTSKTWGYMPSLQDHFQRHGRDFQCTSADDYAAKAWMFLQYARRNNLPMKWDATDRTLRVWEPKSRAFAAYNADGTTKTFFRPNSDSYWSRQPGKPIQPEDLPF